MSYEKRFIEHLKEVDEHIEQIPNEFCDPQHWVNWILEGADNLKKENEKRKI